MADKFIEFIIEDPSEIIRGLDREEANKKQLARDLVDEFGTFALNMLRMNVPVHSSYLLRHTDKSSPRLRSEGGVRSYETTVGIKSGTSRHPLYVEFGTGIYGAVGWYITPVTALNMTWYSTLYGRVISRKFTRGQRAQRYFYETWKEVEVYARMQLLRTTINPLR